MCIIRWLEGPLGLAVLFQNLLLRDLKYQKKKKVVIFLCCLLPPKPQSRTFVIGSLSNYNIADRRIQSISKPAAMYRDTEPRIR